MIGSVMCVCGSTVTFWQSEDTERNSSRVYVVIRAKHVSFARNELAEMIHDFPVRDPYTIPFLSAFMCERIILACAPRSKCDEFWRRMKATLLELDGGRSK